MRVLILTISAGQGHNKTARAMCDYFRSRQVEASIVDVYKYFNTALYKLVDKGYLLSTKYMPKTYGNIYRHIEKNDYRDKRFNSVQISSRIVARQFARYISEKNPDVVIATHIFAADLMSGFRKRGLIDVKTLGIITDFTVHPFWETADIDYYVTPSELLGNQLAKKGIPADRVLPFGIPIEEKFSRSMDKQAARKELGIEDKTTIFVITGSMGYGNVIKYIRQMDRLEQDFQIVCVCGNNKHLKEQVDKLHTHKKIYNFGFVNNVDVMMDAADYIVSKPGGLTVSEALAKGLPMILIDPIPGQEDRNFEFLLNNGLALGVTDTFPIDEALYQLMQNPNRAQYMSHMVRQVGKPYACKQLGDFIIELGN